jgi:radical SAM superfamily enzyme with C-terminal helix-hairpin-helix motif
MTRYRVHLKYEDVFEEEADSPEEAIERVRECWRDGHDPFLLGNEPEIFAYEYAGDPVPAPTSRLARDLDRIEKTGESVPLETAAKDPTKGVGA